VEELVRECLGNEGHKLLLESEDEDEGTRSERNSNSTYEEGSEDEEIEAQFGKRSLGNNEDDSDASSEFV